MNTLISIIIPIYNVERYLKRCLDSVIHQTYTNLEIILVDDGSLDSCPQICDEYASKDNRIIVIHKKNGGLSEARNAGLNICKGDFITFIDSDDWINKKYIDILLNLALKEYADIAIGENIRTDGKNIVISPNSHINSYTSNEALVHLFTKNHDAFIISCGKLYKKHLFSTLRFPIGKFHEDEFTTYILFYNSKKIVYTSELLYYYYQRAGSIASTRHPWDVLDYLEKRYLFFKEKKETKLLSYLLPPLCWQLLCAYWNQSTHKQKDSANKYLNQLRYYTNDFKFIKISLFHFISLTIFSHIPQLYLLYRKLSPLHIRKDF